MADLSFPTDVTPELNNFFEEVRLALENTTSYTDEDAQDAVDALLTAGTNIQLTYDDAGDSLTIDVSPQGGGSGLNADMVDGEHASAFADAGHSHAHSEITSVGSSDHHTRYADSEAVSAVESGPLSFIKGDNGHQIRFDQSTGWIVFWDGNNNREEIVTEDVYIDVQSEWLGSGHMSDSNAHHSRYSDSEAISAVETNEVSHINLANNESGSFGSDGELWHDASAGLYHYSSNNGGTALVWDNNNVTAGAWITISTASEGHPTVNVDRDRLVRDSPNGHVPVSELENGESVEITVPVDNGETLTVYRWGAYTTSGSTPSGLDVELLDGSDTVQATQHTADAESVSGVASHSNSSGSFSVFKLRVANDSGSTVNAGGHFGYIVE